MHSKRLYYEKFGKNDLESYLSWYTDESVMKFITGKALDRKAAEDRFANAIKINETPGNFGFYMARLNSDNSFIGIGKLTMEGDDLAEIGYGMTPDYWGQGFGKEILDHFMDVAKQHPAIHELMGVVDPNNIASKKILESRGFELKKKEMVYERPADFYYAALKK